MCQNVQTLVPQNGRRNPPGGTTKTSVWKTGFGTPASGKGGLAVQSASNRGHRDAHRLRYCSPGLP